MIFSYEPSATSQVAGRHTGPKAHYDGLVSPSHVHETRCNFALSSDGPTLVIGSSFVPRRSGRYLAGAVVVRITRGLNCGIALGGLIIDAWLILTNPGFPVIMIPSGAQNLGGCAPSVVI